MTLTLSERQQAMLNFIREFFVRKQISADHSRDRQGREYFLDIGRELQSQYS